MIEWRTVAGWEGKYLISNTGSVHRTNPSYRNGYKVEVLARPTKTGYLQAWLGGAQGRNHYIHRLVAFAFIGAPPSDRHEIAHWDGNKANNSVNNLRWATRAENSADKRRHDSHPKLTSANVIEIRQKFAADAKMSRTETAKEFGVTPGTISAVIKQRIWK